MDVSVAKTVKVETKTCLTQNVDLYVFPAAIRCQISVMDVVKLRSYDQLHPNPWIQLLAFNNVHHSAENATVT